MNCLLPPETLRAIVEGASDGMFVTDAEFRIEWVNAAACALIGREYTDIVGRRIGDLLWDPDDLRRAPLRRDDLLAGRPTMTTRTFRTAANTPRVLEVSAKLIGDGRLLGIARDATDRLAAEERLRRSEASFRMLIERSPFAVLIHRKGRVVYANSECARLLLWPDAQSGIGKPVIELGHVDDQPRIIDRIRKLQAGEDVVPFTEERIRRADGTFFPASVGGMSVEFEGEPAIVVLARDITAQRRVEEQLARADRLSSLGTLAAGVAHEINNPLTYVMLHLEAIRSAAKGDCARLREQVDNAAEGAQRVARIVRDLSVFSRSEPDLRQHTDVRAPIGVAINTASHELKHRARVVQDLASVPPVLASDGRIAQIVLNLLLNAAHAIPEGHPDDHEIRVTTRASGSGVHIAVRDTGCGIAEEHLKRLFEPFFTTKPVGEGSGLGLAICHALVAALGGRIEVESELGRGSTFTIILPAAAESVVDTATERSSPMRRAGRARVLVIDDEPAIVAAVARSLEERHDVVTETGGRAARARIETDDDFDAVICDVVMPDLSGPELYQWMVAQRPALSQRVIFVSGGRGSEARRVLGDLANGRWLDKPFTLEALENAIAGMLLTRS